MNYQFDTSIIVGYTSKSQQVRLMSEQWAEKNIYCPSCGNPYVQKLPNNKPVADFICENCGEIFELKSKQGMLGKKVADGAYDTIINRISSTTNPNLFVLSYSGGYEVKDLVVIPKFFFVPSIIEKRNPLSPTARRANWVGCNILIGDIPEQGKIPLIINQSAVSPNEVLERYKKAQCLKEQSIEARGWLLDILNCINKINKIEFVLTDVYQFIDELKLMHSGNHNIEAKIRQQLQLLRDREVIEFLGNGHYRKLMI